MSEGRESPAEIEKRLAKADEKPDLDGMETYTDATTEGDLGDLSDDDGSNEGDDEHVVIKDGDTTAMQRRYAVDDKPDFYHMVTHPLESLAKNDTTRITNDWYLTHYDPIDLFGKSQKHLERQHASYETKSAYDKKTHTYAPFVEQHRPLHAMTEGGKGITMYTRPVVYLTADMSTINNVNITFGCPSNCSFCKESILARGYTQLSVDESTGIIRVEIDGGEPFEVPSKSKVKFFDTKVQKIIFGPLSVAIVNEFPIATESLNKLRSRDLVRLLSD